MANLALFRFTDLADNAKSGNGWYIFDKSVVIKTLAGNDTIIGNSRGIWNYGTINTGTGKDIISGIGNRYYEGINNYGTIISGGGNDIIKGTVFNLTGNSHGIENYGAINSGTGNDIITGKGNSDGICNYGAINTGAGNDIIAGNCHNFGSTGIFNSGTINTGAGNDIIRVTSRNVVSIYNDGTINTGTGNDIVDGLKDGFYGDGKTYLGDGDDTLKGFGEGWFYGGTGTDKILFGEGTYTVSESTIISSQFDTMSVSQFEQIGGANGGLFTFGNGTLTVDSAGIATFA